MCIAIMLYNPSKSKGVPAALIFILIGFFSGNGQFSPAYDFPEITETISQFALSFIVFNGGFTTPFNKIKPVLKEGLLLSNLGVLLSSLIMGGFTSLVTPLSLGEGFLLGAIVSSTDAAITFSILETKQLKLKHNTDKALEFESATNDPMALILTLLFTTMLLGGEDGNSFGYYLLFFIKQVFIGAIFAFIAGKVAIKLFDRFTKAEEPLKPIFIIALLLAISLLAGELGGNILVASYILGITLGNTNFTYKASCEKFFVSVTWLAQGLMFLLLGFQIFPGQVLKAIPLAIVPTLFLFFITRPVTVFSSYLFAKAPVSKKLFISWVGIKGATPIVFALIPLIEGVSNAPLIFNITVVIVVTSIVLHGFTMELMASKSGVLDTDSE